MKYIHLTNDTFILQTSEGPFNLSRTSFNFNKIKKLVKDKLESKEEEIFRLLETPDLPNGIYQAYFIKDTDKLIYSHMTKNEDSTTVVYYSSDGESFSMISPELKVKLQFLGVYASKEELLLDWPEYVI